MIREMRTKIPTKRDSSRWVPPGQEVTVGPYRIPDGMVYVGERLPAVNRWVGTEPALIRPSLPLRGTVSQALGSLRTTYGLSYGALAPAERAGYLGWLAEGRRAPDAPLTSVVLFLFGLERRILHDPQLGPVPGDETRRLLDEIERLLDLYKGYSTLGFYAIPLLLIGRLLQRELRIEALEAFVEETGHSSPPVLQAALSLLAAAGEPIPPHWGFVSWTNWSQARRPTAVRRCSKEFRELFLIRYREAFPEGGLRVKRGRKSLVVVHHPANPGFALPLSITLSGTPDAYLGPDHLRGLQQVADRVGTELDAYSRWIGRGGDPASLAACALLPRELARTRETPASRRLLQWLSEMLAGHGFALVPWAEVLKRWPSETRGRLTRGAFEAFVSYLGGLGYGVEPDPRFGDPVPREGPFLFLLPKDADPSWRPGPAYTAAAAVLQLAVIVATADGAIDPRREEPLLAHIEKAAHLTPGERERLHLRLLWLLAEPQGLTHLEKRLETLEEPQRRAAVRFLIVLAGADGAVSPAEIRQLKRIYRLLGLDPGSLYADIHAVAAGASLDEMDALRPGLDLRRVEDKLAETVQASALLGEIFGEEEVVAAPEPAPAGGLEEAHLILLRELAEREVWERPDFAQRAAVLGLLPEGALEMLNEAAFHLAGAPLLEGDEVLEVDPGVLRQMLEREGVAP